MPSKDPHNKKTDTGQGLTGRDSTYENKDEISRGFTAGDANENQDPDEMRDWGSYSSTATNLHDELDEKEPEAPFGEEDQPEDEDDFEGPRRS
jgi:hypothetical protein